LIRKSPNEETLYLFTEFISKKEQTQGIETSYVPGGKESKNDSRSSGERNGKSLNFSKKFEKG